MREAVRALKVVVLTIFIALIFIFPFISQSQTWDSVKKQFIPEDVADRPPQVSYSPDFDRDIFTRENFYDKSAGTRQYRRTIRTPEKNMNFEVYNPVDDPAAVAENPKPETGVIKKDGKTVTVISIKEESETTSKTK